MIVLLDENFPLGLLRSLQNDGLSAQHIITLGWRGASEARIRERLQDDQVVFLTQDEDFCSVRQVARSSSRQHANDDEDHLEHASILSCYVRQINRSAVRS